jgi:hypothetical protein
LIRRLSLLDRHKQKDKAHGKAKGRKMGKTAKRTLGKLGTNKNDSNVNAVDSDQTAFVW